MDPYMSSKFAKGLKSSS